MVYGGIAETGEVGIVGHYQPWSPQGSEPTLVLGDQLNKGKRGCRSKMSPVLGARHSTAIAMAADSFSSPMFLKEGSDIAWRELNLSQGKWVSHHHVCHVSCNGKGQLVPTTPVLVGRLRRGPWVLAPRS